MQFTRKGPSFTLGGWAAVIALLGLFITVLTRSAISEFEQAHFSFPIKYALLCICLVVMIGLREYYLKEVARESEEKYDQKFEELVNILSTTLLFRLSARSGSPPRGPERYISRI